MALYFGRPLDSNQCTLLNDKVVFWLAFCHSVCPCPSVSESRSAYWLVVFIPLTGSSLLISREKWPLKLFAKPNEPAKAENEDALFSRPSRTRYGGSQALPPGLLSLREFSLPGAMGKVKVLEHPIQLFELWGPSDP